MIRNGDTALYKIGFTRGTAAVRIKGMQTGNPATLTEVARFAIAGSTPARCERFVHARFHSNRVLREGGTEWFEFAAGLPVSLISRAVAEYNADVKLAVDADAAAADVQDGFSAVCADDHIKNLLDQYAELAANDVLASVQMDRIKQKLRIYMRSASVILVGGVPVVRWKEQTANRFALDEFKAAHPDLYAKFLRPSTTRPMTFARN